MRKKKDKNYFDCIQIFRGIAATMVVLHHSLTSIKYYHNYSSSFLDYFAYVGKFGVDFFFVLSGFIISYSSYINKRRKSAFNNYINHRFFRIYVPYLPIGISMLLLYTFIPELSNSSRDISILTSFTLIPNGNPALSVAWTLSFEIIFYLLFSMYFLSQKLWNGFVVFWLTLIVAYNLLELPINSILTTPIFKTLFSLYNLEFLIGYALSILVVKGFTIPKKGLFLLVLTSSFLFVLSLQNAGSLPYFSVNLIFALGVFLVLLLFITYYNYSINKNFLPMLIGNASYSIYLIHNPVQSAVVRFFPDINSLFYFILALLLCLLLSVSLGYLYYKVFERKATRVIKSIVSG